MNLKSLISIAALALNLPGLSVAQEATSDYPQPFTSSVSRADVRSAAVAARRSGQIADGEQSVVPAPSLSLLTRAQVRAEAAEAVRLGLNRRTEAQVFATPAELEQIRLAGLRAIQGDLTARR